MNTKFMKLAIDEAQQALDTVGNGPFGACIVKGDNVIAVANNSVVLDNDPTAHAEINAIRLACKSLGSFNLQGCELYSTSEPCPMCLSAIYWSHLDKLYYGCSRSDAANVGFDDEFIYEELAKNQLERKIETYPGILKSQCAELFKMWDGKSDKIDY